MLVKPLEVNGGRQLFVFQRQDKLDKSGDSRRRRAMTDIALYRAQGAVVFLLGIFFKGTLQSFHLNGIT